MTKHPNLSIYKDLEFPPELPDDYFEPIGIEYGRYKDWQDLQTLLDTLPPLQVTQPESEPPTPPPDSPAMLQSQPNNDESAATMAATAAVATIPPNIVASPVAAAAVPNQSGTQDYGPQNNYNRRLGPMTAYAVSAANQ